jgi:hypothetical protein
VRSIPRRVVTLKTVNPDLPVLWTPPIASSPPRCDFAFSIKTDRKRFDSTTNMSLGDPLGSLWERSPVAPRPNGLGVGVKRKILFPVRTVLTMEPRAWMLVCGLSSASLPA